VLSRLNARRLAVPAVVEAATRAQLESLRASTLGDAVEETAAAAAAGESCAQV